MIDVVCTDLDGVLRRWDEARTRAVEARYGLAPGAMTGTAFAPELLEPAITGAVSDEAWRGAIIRQLKAAHPAADAEAAVNSWSRAAGRVNEDVLELLRRCRRQTALVLITNATSRLEEDLLRLHLACEFDLVINSSEIGVAKPDPRIFQVALERAGAPPKRSFFVDDMARHVRAARRLGMHAHRFKNADALAGALTTLGVLP